MKAQSIGVKYHGTIPDVDQGIVNGWYLSHNPDDGRFYVCAGRDGVATKTYSLFRNAIYWARNHNR